MNELNVLRTPAMTTFPKWSPMFFKMAGVVLLTVLSGCGEPGARSQAGPRDHLHGWYKVTKGDTLIPVFKRDGTYYSVCRGFEIPFKECPEGLEWALTPSSMVGTKIGWDAASKTAYLAVVDAQASNFTDGGYGTGEKEPMTRLDKPSGLLDAKARPPRTHDDFLGWYQLVWTPGVRIEIRKDGDRYFSQDREFGGPKPGSWTTRVEPRELTRLPDQLGFTGFDRKKRHRLVYNDTLNRFELVMGIEGTTSSIIRMPLARISAPSSPEGGRTPSPMVAIGIPSWH